MHVSSRDIVVLATKPVCSAGNPAFSLWLSASAATLNPPKVKPLFVYKNTHLIPRLITKQPLAPAILIQQLIKIQERLYVVTTHFTTCVSPTEVGIEVVLGSLVLDIYKRGRDGFSHGWLGLNSSWRRQESSRAADPVADQGGGGGVLEAAAEVGGRRRAHLAPRFSRNGESVRELGEGGGARRRQEDRRRPVVTEGARGRVRPRRRRGGRRRGGGQPEQEPGLVDAEQLGVPERAAAGRAL